MSFSTRNRGVRYEAWDTSINEVRGRYESKTIWKQWQQARNQEDDIHMKLMKNYKDAPDWSLPLSLSSRFLSLLKVSKN